MLISAFISLTYLQSHFRVKVSLYKKSIDNTNLGIKYAYHQETPYGVKTNIEFDESLDDITTYIKTHWGIFDLISVQSTVKDEIFQKIALLGGNQPKRNALYLQDTKRPLIVVGNTVIKGNAALSKSGVKRGSISGHSYAGSQLIYGNITASNSAMPKIRNSNFIKNFSKNLILLDSLDFIDLSENKTRINSFNKATQIYKSYDAIHLNFIELSGNIIIQSETSIRVNSSAKLKDIILVAPKIEIEDDVMGTFQAIATKNISLGKNCNLLYPSALILVEEFLDTTDNIKQEEISQIIMASNSEVKGLVCYLCDKTPNLYKPQILVEENTVIKGELYCEQNLELKGKVEGMVYTKGFIANQYGSIYQNHIYNAKIIVNDLPKQYSGLQFESFPQSIVKWLY